MDCGLSFAKYSVFIFNFIFAIAGIGMITAGGIAHSKIADYNDFLQNYLTAVPILLIVVGAVIFFIAFLGCCGAIKENTCMLCLFSITLIAIVAVEIAIVVTAFTMKEKVQDFIDKRLEETLHTSVTNKEFFKSWDLMQREMKCCGVHGYKDWEPIFNYVHPACCLKDVNDKTCTVPTYTKGCEEALKEFVSNNVLLVAGVAIGVGIFQLFGIVFSCCLYSAYRRNYHY